MKIAPWDDIDALDAVALVALVFALVSFHGNMTEMVAIWFKLFTDRKFYQQIVLLQENIDLLCQELKSPKYGIYCICE